MKEVALQKSREKIDKNGLDLGADFMGVFILWAFIKMYSYVHFLYVCYT